MAIAIEGFTIVALKARIAEKCTSGIEAIHRETPNATALADDDLWRCSFMAHADAERFLGRLERLGLNTSQGPDPDAVLVSEFDQSIAPYCEWLQVAPWDKGVIAWLAGTTPRSVVAREGWSPEKGSGLTFESSKDQEHLEFVRHDGNVSVYFDKRLGREVYIGRTTPDPEEVYKSAAKVVTSHLVDPGQPPLTGDAADKVRQAVAALRPIAEQFPQAWAVHWMIGKGLLALGELEDSYAALLQAYHLDNETEAIARELAGVCLALGRADEAVKIGQHAAALRPDSADTLGNLACAYLIAGKLAEAEATIQAALRLDENDRTNRAIQARIEAVRRGKRPQPRRLADLA